MRMQDTNSNTTIVSINRNNAIITKLEVEIQIQLLFLLINHLQIY